MIVTTDDFTSHVVAHAGVATGFAARVTRVVLAGIGGYLSPGARQLVAGELPPELGAVVLAGSDLAGPIEEHVLALVPDLGPDLGPNLGPNLGHARELIASVCRVLVEELSTDALGVIRAAVPSTLAPLFQDATASEAPPHAVAGYPRDTLAEGRPGSHHPVSSAHGAGGQSESIAAGNPHAATKLSSASGSTQERHRETIAEGRPGSPNPIADSRR